MVKELTRKMKDSGVEWIGEIPEEWEVQNLKSILEERNEMNNPIKTESILSLTNDRGVIPYSEKGDIGNKSKEDLTKYKLVYPNDIVVNSMNVIIGSVGLSDYFGATSPVYYMLYPRNYKDSVKYYNYLFQTKEFQSKLVGYGNGIMEHRMRIPMMNLNKVHLPYPDSLEQKSIADFLDKKTQEIDNIISKTKKAIEEYKKYKQSLITETVTKGLDKDVEMKDSGIEWIGEIPKHWDLIRLQSLVKLRDTKGPYNPKEDLYVGLENIESYTGKYVATDTKYEENIYTEFKSRDILFNTLRPYLTKVYYANFSGYCTSEFLVIRGYMGIKKYLFYQLINSRFVELINSSTYGSKMPRANWNFMKDIYLPLPPLKEQEQIASYLDKKCSQIDNIISTKEKLLIEMEAYKKSLIYETVTGKREVE